MPEPPVEPPGTSGPREPLGTVPIGRAVGPTPHHHGPPTWSQSQTHRSLLRPAPRCPQYYASAPSKESAPYRPPRPARAPRVLAAEARYVDRQVDGGPGEDEEPQGRRDGQQDEDHRPRP